jgi:hypothetical protein
MTLEDFTNNCIKLMKDRPETADYKVVSSIDSEGNSYNNVYYSPSVGMMNEDDEFYNEEDEEGCAEFMVACRICSGVVCIN